MVSQRDIKAGGAIVTIGAKDTALTAGLKSAEAKVKQFGANLASVGTSLAGLGAAIVGPLTAATKVFSSMGDELDKMSKRTGVTVEALSEMKFVAAQSGTNFATLENAFRKMQRSVYDASRGVTTIVDGFKDLGLSYADLAGKAPEEQFKILAEALSRVDDHTRKAGIAMTLFGRTGTNLLPMFENGRAGIDALANEARELGLTISGDAATAAAEFTDKMNALWSQIKIAVFEVGSALAPAIVELTNSLRETLKATIEWIRQNQDLIVTVGKIGAVLVGVGGAMLAAGKIVAGIATAFKLAAVVTKVFTAALWVLTAHPIVAALALIAAGVGAITYAIYKSIGAEQRQAQQRRRQHNERIRQLNEQRRKEAELAAERRKQRTRMLTEAVGAKKKVADEKVGRFMAKDKSPLQRQIEQVRAEAKEAVDALKAQWDAELLRQWDAGKRNPSDVDETMKHKLEASAAMVNAAAERRIEKLTTEAGNREAMERQAIIDGDIARRVKAIQEKAQGVVATGKADTVQRLLANSEDAAKLWESHQRLKAKAARLGDKASGALKHSASMGFMEYAMSSREGKAFDDHLVEVGRSIAGTFSSERLGGLGASSPMLKEQKKANKKLGQIANNTKPKPMGP